MTFKYRGFTCEPIINLDEHTIEGTATRWQERGDPSLPVQRTYKDVHIEWQYKGLEIDRAMMWYKAKIDDWYREQGA